MEPKGFTRFELSVVVAVIAVLAAILTPLVTAYIDQVRNNRAIADVRAIAQAFQLHKRDTGQFPVYANVMDSEDDTESETELVGNGNVPTILGASWDLTSSGDMDTFLNTNKLNLPTNNPGRDRVAYRGPYLEEIGQDPWGNQYVVNAINLLRSSTSIGFAISAGPNGNLDTDRDQVSSGSLTTTGDDIVVRIQ